MNLEILRENEKKMEDFYIIRKMLINKFGKEYDFQNGQITSKLGVILEEGRKYAEIYRKMQEELNEIKEKYKNQPVQKATARYEIEGRYIEINKANGTAEYLTKLRDILEDIYTEELIKYTQSMALNSITEIIKGR